MNKDSIQLSVIFDNIHYDKCCKSLWGFGSYIKTQNHTILFDTGSNGRALLENLETKGLDIQEVDTIFISHFHWDHIGGIDSILELNPNVNIFVNHTTSKNFIRDMDAISEGVEIIGKEFTKIYDDIYSTGELNSSKEHSLVLDTSDGAVIVTGCSHAGVGEIAKEVAKNLQKEILLIVGGFHLSDKSDNEIKESIKTLKSVSTKFVAPSHCTGEKASEIFKQEFGSRYIDSGAGLDIDLATLNL